MIDNAILAKRKLNKSQMLSLGFDFSNGSYFLQTKIINDEFLLQVSIDQNNVVTSNVVELETNELYTLYNVKDSVGGFVAKMRNAYNGIIEQIQQNCSTKDVFKSSQALQIIEYISQKYGDNIEFLWEKLGDDNAIARNKINNKWYLVLMTISQSKLGLPSNQMTEIINLRFPAEKLSCFVDNQKYFRAFHMNKKHWISVKLDDTVATEKIFELICQSYDISLKRK